MKIYLASGSPRRKELLSLIGIEYEIKASNADEIVEAEIPFMIVEELSLAKARAVAESLPINTDETICVIGADTVVSYNDEIMGKPVDEADARRMLKQLSGNTHQVYTGVTLYILRNGISDVRIFHVKTDVTMYDLTDEQIDAYIATKEPMDKAGAYGIQAKAAAFVKEINGDYYNVVGLPIGRLYQELCKLEAFDL